MKLIILIFMAFYSLGAYSCDFFGNKNQDERLSLSKNIYIGSIVEVKSEDYQKYISKIEPFTETDRNFFKHGEPKEVIVTIRQTLKGKPLKSSSYSIDKGDNSCSVISEGKLYDTVVIYENDNNKIGLPIKESEYKRLANKFDLNED